MPVVTELLQCNMTGNNHIENLTQTIQQYINESGLQSGLLTVFVKHTTAALLIIEDEPGIRQDTNNFWNKLIPAQSSWSHNTLNPGEDNGHSHLRGQLQSPSISIPFNNRSLMLGAWQQIVLIDFDTRSRTRDVVLQLIGE